MGNGCLDQLMLAENPLAFWVLYLIKYIGNFTYFIWDAMARLLKTSCLVSGNTSALSMELAVSWDIGLVDVLEVVIVVLMTYCKHVSIGHMNNAWPWSVPTVSVLNTSHFACHLHIHLWSGDTPTLLIQYPPTWLKLDVTLGLFWWIPPTPHRHQYKAIM